MRKIIIVFLLTSLHLFGEDSTSGKIFKRWEIGLSFSPDYSYRVLKPNLASDDYSRVQNRANADSVNMVEKGTVSYSIGIPISYKFKKLFTIKTGVYLSNKTIQSKGFIYGNIINNYSYSIFKSSQWEKSSFLFLEIPIALELNFHPKNSKKLSYKLFTGITFCNNIQKHSYLSRRYYLSNLSNPALESSSPTFNVDKFNLLYFGYTAGIGAVYNLNEKLNIGIEPVFKFYSKGFNAAPTTDKYSLGTVEGTNEKPYSFGCNISLNYMF